ncbi:MAG: nitrogenase component 1 [Oscillospiraceae bacterium]
MISTIIPCYAADTSGVCSALYELGGMVVVHDASGCNSTYATHDEPRWYEMQSMIYISALTETDAIFGNDEKLIADIVSSAKDQKPKFIAVCGSPMPMMIGTDFDAIAYEIEQRTNIPTIPLHTNGTRDYIQGASQALKAIAERFVKPSETKIQGGVNVLGATPLDFKWKGTVSHIRQWLEENGLQMVSCFAMDSSLDEIKKASSAEVNLVLSMSGMETAKYLEKTFGIPYVCGVPVGELFAKKLAETLHESIQKSQNLYPCTERISGSDTVIIGESIYSGSIACEITMQKGYGCTVLTPLPYENSVLCESDSTLKSESEIREFLNQIISLKNPASVIADPFYQFILPEGATLIKFPHFAFSGRCFDQRIPDVINRNIKEFYHD